ncbi:hypothetical protein [Nostoc sp. 'Peltigera membranacea cyanobiont' 232]|uniref:hypothetical protein n=1 Tax=Nostoc sp. 'Peltigera membranacea cyanobiont' 232 TaxID=2014531 RepID=UPI000B957A99|nr:hypothetical protein [Nostoc sp. 'Peltigera membranacea cyanobiont' 232]OYE04147.1 hypothetical protein CDG79_14965 [Nostoc sp. 'Peltigera membranacea cyanobiont' 232]
MGLRCNPIIPWLILVLSIVTIVLALMIGNGLLILSSIVQIVFSILRLQDPLYFIYSTEIVGKNLVGMSFVKHRFDSYRDLLIENDRLYLFKNGRKIKITSKFFYHPEDWKAMVETIRDCQL